VAAARFGVAHQRIVSPRRWRARAQRGAHPARQSGVTTAAMVEAQHAGHRLAFMVYGQDIGVIAKGSEHGGEQRARGTPACRDCARIGVDGVMRSARSASPRPMRTSMALARPLRRSARCLRGIAVQLCLVVGSERYIETCVAVMLYMPKLRLVA